MAGRTGVPKTGHRLRKAWDAYLRGDTVWAIADSLGISVKTVYRDLAEAKRLLQREDTSDQLDELRAHAIQRRLGLSALVLHKLQGVRPTDGVGTAALLRELREHSKSIEELQGIRQKQPEHFTENQVVVFQVGTVPPRPLSELSDDELALVEMKLLAEAGQLPAPKQRGISSSVELDNDNAVEGEVYDPDEQQDAGQDTLDEQEDDSAT